MVQNGNNECNSQIVMSSGDQQNPGSRSTTVPTTVATPKSSVSSQTETTLFHAQHFLGHPGVKRENCVVLF